MQVKTLGPLNKSTGLKGSLESKPNPKHNRLARELKMCSFVAGFVKLDAVIWDFFFSGLYLTLKNSCWSGFYMELSRCLKLYWYIFKCKENDETTPHSHPTPSAVVAQISKDWVTWGSECGRRGLVLPFCLCPLRNFNDFVPTEAHWAAITRTVKKKQPRLNWRGQEKSAVGIQPKREEVLKFWWRWESPARGFQGEISGTLWKVLLNSLVGCSLCHQNKSHLPLPSQGFFVWLSFRRWSW